MRLILLALAFLLAAPAHACAMAPDDAAWITRALANWRVAERTLLKLTPAPLPTIVTFDARCRFVARPHADGRVRWAGTRHDGKVALPDGKRIPAAVVAFAAPLGSTGFFVMALPSVWRAEGVDTNLGLERLLDGVLLHELMHTRQFYFVNPRFAALAERYRDDDVSDDSLQKKFESDPRYAAAYKAERDLLYAAAKAPNVIATKRIARRALARMRDRRTIWFTADDTKWKAYDELFLTMEGLGQWLAYAWTIDPNGAALPPATTLVEVRRGGRYWTQDEGLALFLVIDRLLPDWQALAFAKEPETVEALLARAVQ